MIYNSSMESGVFPDFWKLARATPIFKSGNESDANNYRPISIISVFARIFEKIVHDLVRDTISESLSGFPQKSQTPIEALWSLRSIDLRVIALHPSFVKLRIPQNASLVPLISEPIRVNVISFVIYKRGNSQYPEQDQLYNFLSTNNILTPSQSAFRKLHSTITSLINCTDNWYRNIQKEFVLVS